MFKCRLWMLISLPAYRHDHPNFVVCSDRNTRQSANKVHSEQVSVEPQDYTAEAWHAAVLRDTPALFKIPGFSPDVMKSGLRAFTLSDTHLFCTSGGGHGSQGTSRPDMRLLELRGLGSTRVPMSTPHWL